MIKVHSFTSMKPNGCLAVGYGALDIAACLASAANFSMTVIWDQACCLRDPDKLTPCWTAEDVNVTHRKLTGTHTHMRNIL